jgi:hypothetical protein
MGVSDLSRYELLVLPDEIVVDDGLAAALRGHLSRGGAVLATGTSGLSADGEAVTFRELGLVPTGMSPFDTTYVRFGKRIDVGIPPTDHVMYERSVRVAPAPNALSLAVVVEPYFQRSWRHFSSHRQTPPDKPTKFSAAVLNGRCAYVAYPIFGMFARHGSAVYRTFVRNVIDLLLPQPLLQVGGPTGLEASVTKQSDRTIVHLLYYSAEWRTPHLDLIEDVTPLFDVPVSLKVEREPDSVSLAPEKRPVDFTYHDGRVELRVPEVRGHAMLVVE